MKFKNHILIYILFSISIFLTTIIWDKIYISYNELNIIGEYSEKKYHSLNDLLRYFIFISIPITIFFSQVFFDKNKRENLLKNINDKSYFLFVPNRLNLFFAFFIFFIILFEFLSLDFQIHNLDRFEFEAFFGKCIISPSLSILGIISVAILRFSTLSTSLMQSKYAGNIRYKKHLKSSGKNSFSQIPLFPAPIPYHSDVQKCVLNL